MKYLIAALAAFALISAPVAGAVPDHDSKLCSFNMAYRVGHAKQCASVEINSHGGGSAPTVEEEEEPTPTDGGESTGGESDPE